MHNSSKKHPAVGGTYSTSLLIYNYKEAGMPYANTNEKLYDDIALWEKTNGKDLFLEMP